MIKDVLFETDSKIGLGSLLLVPEADYNLLGQDLMIELGISLEVTKNKINIKSCPLPTVDENKF